MLTSGGKIQDWARKIIHVDMDAFFAAVEQRDHPQYKGKPVIVGGDPFGRGVVSTCSYEARKFGVHSAMPAAQARRLCPQAVFLRPNFERYEEVSSAVMSILRQHTGLVEQVSLDEAYLDVTHHRLGIDDPVMIAKLIKQNIFAVTQLTASAGVAPNRFLAKIASDFKKPDGLTVVYPGRVLEFLAPLPVRKIPGVGPVTEAQLAGMQIFTCADLAACHPLRLRERFGKTGIFLHERAQGRDDSEVVPDAPPKQYSTEETFPFDVTDIRWLKSKLREYAEQVFSGLQAMGRMGRTVSLKVKYHDFELVSREKTLDHYPVSGQEIYHVAAGLLVQKTLAGKKAVRLLGLGICGLEDPAATPVDKIKNPQKELFV